MATSRSTTTDERVVDEVKRAAAAGLDGAELLRRTARAIGRVVPFDAYCASTVDPASHLPTAGISEGLAERSSDPELEDFYFNRIYFAHDLEQGAAMLRQRRPVTLLSEATSGRLEQSLRYRELLQPLRLQHELNTVFVERNLWGGMDLIRGLDRPDFAPHEVALIRRLAPHVAAGLRSAALRVRATVEPAGDDAPGVLTLDQRGRVVSATPAAERHLADLGELAPGWRDGRDLPTPVRTVVGALGAALQPQSDQARQFVPRLQVRGRSGRWLTLHASLTEPAPDRPSERVIVIAPARAAELLWLRLAAYGLSPREEEIIKLVVRGRSTRQIADTLFISEHTVQRHIANIFEKVGTRSRPALMQRLFVEHLLPSVGDS
jgi:DNA-binding CsgD family transcriptional regulator